LGLNDISEEYEEPTASTSLGYKSINEIEESFQVKKNMLFAKLSEERLSRQIKQQQTFLPKYLNNPDDLIGRKISHKCFENNIVQWFSAVVDSIKIKKKVMLLKLNTMFGMMNVQMIFGISLFLPI
jgi:hypothetical protein